MAPHESRTGGIEMVCADDDDSSASVPPHDRAGEAEGFRHDSTETQRVQGQGTGSARGQSDVLAQGNPRPVQKRRALDVGDDYGSS